MRRAREAEGDSPHWAPPPASPVSLADASRVSHWTFRSALYQVLLCGVILCLSTRGITNEATVSLQGDMPRYLMNGVYFYDLIRDLPLTDPIGYTQRYFAKYPALSLGHHPLFLGWAEVPFYALFGVSVLAGRMTILCLMLVGAVAWFHAVQRIYDDEVAFFATLLLVTTPFVARFSWVVMSEIPTLALVLASTYCFLRFCDTLQRRDAFLFATVAALSCYGKQLAVFTLPIFLVYFIIRRGIRPLFRPDVLLASLLMAVLLAPLVPITLVFSRVNMYWVAEGAGAGGRFNSTILTYYLSVLWRHHLTVPLLVVSVFSAAASLVRRDGRILFFVLWVLGFYLGITYLGVQDPRFAIYWIPPFCLFAASSLTLATSRRMRVGIAVGLVAVGVYQFVAAYRLNPTYADGYEEAARYILEHPKGQSVLYSARIDTGYFVFFVRKNDPPRRLVVLRADKTLATSGMGNITAENASTPEQIYQLLHDFGVGYVVIEDLQYYTSILELLRQELKTDNFRLVKRIPIRSSDEDINGVDLGIYEYKGYTPAQPDARLEMRIPLIRGEVGVRFGDLLPPEN